MTSHGIHDNICKLLQIYILFCLGPRSYNAICFTVVLLYVSQCFYKVSYSFMTAHDKFRKGNRFGRREQCWRASSVGGRQTNRNHLGCLARCSPSLVCIACRGGAWHLIFIVNGLSRAPLILVLLRPLLFRFLDCLLELAGETLQFCDA